MPGIASRNFLTPTCGRPPQPPPLGKHTKQNKRSRHCWRGVLSYDRITAGSDKTSRRITISDTRNFIEEHSLPVRIPDLKKPRHAGPASFEDAGSLCLPMRSEKLDRRRETGQLTARLGGPVRKGSKRNLRVPESRRWVAPRKK